MKQNRFLVKFSIAAFVLGMLSPAFHIEHKAGGTTVEVTLLKKAEARRGGGARGGARGGGARRARPAGNRAVKRRPATRPAAKRRPATRPATRPSGGKHINRNKNINRNVNRNVNVNHYYGGGGHHHGHHHHHGHYGYHHGHPILAFGAAVAVGSIIAAATMPPSCTTVVYGGVSYRRCDGRYYQPVYQGDTLVYKVVPAPM